MHSVLKYSNKIDWHLLFQCDVTFMFALGMICVNKFEIILFHA